MGVGRIPWGIGRGSRNLRRITALRRRRSLSIIMGMGSRRSLRFDFAIFEEGKDEG